MNILTIDTLKDNIKEFQSYKQSFGKPYEYSSIWKKTHKIPELNQFKQIIGEFIYNGYSRDLAEKFSLNYSFLRRFAYSLSQERSDFDSIIKKSGGLKEGIGLSWAKLKLKEFFENERRLPKVSDFPNISSVAQKKWKKWNIHSWNDLLMDVFGKINLDQLKWRGPQSFSIAKKELLKFYEKENRLPNTSDKKMSSIENCCRKGRWKSEVINNWNDLLMYVFGKVNTEPKKWYYYDGLIRAKQEILKFYERENRLPIVKDAGMMSIYIACNSNNWNEWGIKSWNDLLKQLFGKCNKENKIWYGKKGLERARLLLLNFYKEQNRLPYSTDEGMLSIINACIRKRWIEWGIESWNELMIYTFDRVKNAKVNSKWLGKEGLNRAEYVLREFKEKESRIPTSKDKGINGIYNSCLKGYWKEWKIEFWNDLLKYVFGEIHRRKNIKKKSPAQGKWKGDKSLEKAKICLINFKNKHKRLPNTRDKEISAIGRKCLKGYWKEGEIESWNDLLMVVFGETNKRSRKLRNR